MKITGGSAGFLDATVLFLIWLTKQTVGSGPLSAPEVVTGADGGSVTVACQYDSWYTSNTKYWCRGAAYFHCSIVVKTPRNRHSDRVFIADDKTAGVFTVTMTSLRYSDEDVYWCVLATSGANIRTRVQLYVSHPVPVVTPTATSKALGATVVTPTATPTALGATTTAGPMALGATVVTPIASPMALNHDEISWWATLRWILFILMLCCLVSTHIAVWRIQTAKKNKSARTTSPSQVTSVNNYE